MDTKKKELIGTFKNAGRAWRQEAEAVNVHDFRQSSLGRAVPYGIYDVTHNRGTVYVGSSGDTAQFAVDALAHYPTGCSKWNPIEHRLFGLISLTWAGYPLRTWETLLAYLRGTTTTTGLEVQAVRLRGDYKTGLRVSDAEMARLKLTAHAVCAAWNYTLRPRSDASPASAVTPPKREVIV